MDLPVIYGIIVGIITISLFLIKELTMCNKKKKPKASTTYEMILAKEKIEDTINKDIDNLNWWENKKLRFLLWWNKK